jgi:hypothetical protein
MDDAPNMGDVIDFGSGDYFVEHSSENRQVSRIVKWDKEKYKDYFDWADDADSVDNYKEIHWKFFTLIKTYEEQHKERYG